MYEDDFGEVVEVQEYSDVSGDGGNFSEAINEIRTSQSHEEKKRLKEEKLQELQKEMQAFYSKE